MGSFFRQLEPEFEIANDPIGTLLLGENLLRRSVGGVHVGGVPVGPLTTTTCRKKKVIPNNNEHEMWVEVSHSIYGNYASHLQHKR